VQLRVLAVVLLSQAIGGLAPVMTKLALAGFGPWTVVAVRQVLAALTLWALLRASGRSIAVGRRFDARDRALLLCLSWAGFALPQILLALGIERSTATNGALLSPLEPIGILLGGALLLGERLNVARVIAVVLGTVGATLIVSEGAASPGVGDVVGDSLIALGHLAWAIYTLAAKPLVGRHDPLRITLVSLLLAVPVALPLAATERIDPAQALPALGWLVALGVLASGVLTFAWNWALVRISAGTMAAMIFVQPLVGLAGGVVALGEPTGARALLGAIVILAGVTLAALRGEERVEADARGA
jgi:drug/metabolite transporter (DMT)-like permease